jgi:ABC-type nitrate/sulfonate/bicarbonate transport system substrate-binding protein
MKMRNRKRRRLLLLISLVLSTALHSSAAQATEEKITFGYSSISPDMAGVWMAKETGAFERHGLSADLVYISSGATVIQALVGGSAHAAPGRQQCRGRRHPERRPYHSGGK